MKLICVHMHVYMYTDSTCNHLYIQVHAFMYMLVCVSVCVFTVQCEVNPDCFPRQVLSHLSCL